MCVDTTMKTLINFTECSTWPHMQNKSQTHFTFAEHESLNDMVNCDYEIVWSLPVFPSYLQ